LPEYLHYFAYGSNMSLPRLRHRIGDAQALGKASLSGHQLKFHKRGQDGSAKCDAFFTADDSILYGVLFRIDAESLPTLDRIEGAGAGYDATSVCVTLDSGEASEALTYRATDLDADLVPFCWYRHHVVQGARAFGLPPDYIADIANTPVAMDTDAERLTREYAVYL